MLSRFRIADTQANKKYYMLDSNCQISLTAYSRYLFSLLDIQLFKDSCLVSNSAKVIKNYFILTINKFLTIDDCEKVLHVIFLLIIAISLYIEQCPKLA